MRQLLIILTFFPVLVFGQRFNLADTSFNTGDIFEPVILYDLGTASIRPECQKLLDSIVDFLDKNTNLVIEVGCHGNSMTCEDEVKRSRELYYSRAKAITDYLVKKGVQPIRVGPKGYGCSKPIIPDASIAMLKTEEEIEKAHQRNRRTELKILQTNFPFICIPELDTLNGQQVLLTTYKMPEYPGGQIEMFNFFIKNIKYPNEQKIIQTKVYITFVVDTMGKVRNECIYKPFFYGELSPLEIATMKIISGMPLWKPGEQFGGQKVPVRISLPIELEVK